MTANNLRFLLACSLIFILNQPSFSEENIRYYDVELVVFEPLESNTESNEVWPKAKQLEIPAGAAYLGRKFEGSLPPEYNPRLLFNILPAKDYQLNEDIKKLQESEKFRVLLHTGWRQPGLAKKLAIPVYINHMVAENEADQAEEAVTETETTPPPVAGLVTGQGTVDPAEQLPTAPADKPAAKIEGLLTIVLARYLHLDAELVYKRETDSEVYDMYDSNFLENQPNENSVFYLNQNRRMRSKETHYIDHPKFSMLIRITPYELASTSTPAAPAKKTKVN